MDFVEISTQKDLEAFLKKASLAPRYAIDTEFHRESTYYPDLALIQMRILAPTPISALIDPKGLDLSPFSGLFSSESLALLHAPLQDFEIFDNEVGCIPENFFDTQLAAGFLGFSSPSLASLVNHCVGISISKSDRMTDWNRRPLTQAQKAYALSDVAHLDKIADFLQKDLESLGRLPWVLEAFEEMRSSRKKPIEPQDAWRSISESRSLRPDQKGALRELAAFRELRAQSLNIPPRRVFGDIILVCIAQSLPTNLDELLAVRGFRSSKPEINSALLECVKKGRTHVFPTPPTRPPSADPRAVSLVSAWVADLAAKERLDKALLATRDDVENLLSGSFSRLSTGWRADLLKDVPTKLATGELGLALTPGKGYRLVKA